MCHYLQPIYHPLVVAVSLGKKIFVYFYYDWGKESCFYNPGKENNMYVQSLPKVPVVEQIG